LRCSFCRRDDKHVAKLVAGPRLAIARVYICDKCARAAIRIMDAAPEPKSS
jgi:ATP-dependent protease Clp ATPase subunit